MRQQALQLQAAEVEKELRRFTCMEIPGSVACTGCNQINRCASVYTSEAANLQFTLRKLTEQLR